MNNVTKTSDKPQWRIDMENDVDQREREYQRKVTAARVAELNSLFEHLGIPHETDEEVYEDAQGYRWETKSKGIGTRWLSISMMGVDTSDFSQWIRLEDMLGERRTPSDLHPSVVQRLRELDGEGTDE